MKNTILYLINFIIFLLLQTIAVADENPKLSHVSSIECGLCHQQIYEQWQSSMHAQSTALEDPIHGAFYNSVIGDPKVEGIKKNEKFPVCLQCHAPTAAKDGKTKLDAMAVYQEGVNCVTCHTLTNFKGIRKPEGGFQLGISAYEYSNTELQGPSSNKIHPHVGAKDNQTTISKIKGNPTILKTNTACMGCHEQRNNANNVPLCQTGSEIALSDRTADCQQCHMPVINGKRDHSMMGGHSEQMVSQGLEMTMDVYNKKTLSITLKNKLPHKFPTGAPFRNVFIRVSAYDSSNKEIWRNSQSHPINDDKKSVLMYALGNEKGEQAAPPKATQVMYDSRLKPHETRVVSYTLPQKDIMKIKADVFYDLLLPALKKKFSKQIPAKLTEPKIIATSEIFL